MYIDWPGTVLVGAGLVAVVYGLSEADTAGWGAPPLVLLAAGVVLLAAFVLVERRVPHPLLPLRIVLNRFRGGAYLAIGLSAIGLFGVFLFLTYYLQLTLALLAGQDRPGLPADDRGADRVLDVQRGAAAAVRAPAPDPGRPAGGGRRAGHTGGAAGPEYQLPALSCPPWC